MRVVVDTNVFVAALLQGNTPRKVYDAFLDGDFVPVFSPQLIQEIVQVLARPELRALMQRSEVSRLLALIKRDGFWIRPKQRIRVCRDPKDNILLECALAGRADYIVTGDQDLLILHPFRGIAILKPREFLRRLF